MKTEVYPVSALIGKPRIIKWASYKCETKTHNDKYGIIMHHSAASHIH